MTENRYRWWICLVYTVGITVLSLLPAESFRPIQPLWREGFDKLAHFLVYGCYAALLQWSIGLKERNSLPLFLIVGFCTTYGLALEFLQGALPLCRTFSWGDVAANSLGAGLFGLGAMVYMGKRP